MSTYLVTGSMGCLGAWALHHLVQEGIKVVSFDLSENRSRLDLLMTPEEQEAIVFVKGDLTDAEAVNGVLEQHSVDHILHLAALQVPFCKADPILGAQVNVVGTVTLFEAALKAGIKHLAFASSVGVFGPPEVYESSLLEDDAALIPGTLYGVYKRANEGTARVYWQDHGLSSVTLRPYTVYGLGRDQGLTSEPTKAMLAAASGQDFDISFGGRMQFHFASDVARQFIEAARTPVQGAKSFNLGGEPVAVSKVAGIIEKLRPESRVSVADRTLPFPEGAKSDAYTGYSSVRVTPLEQGIAQTIEQFEARLKTGQLKTP